MEVNNPAGRLHNVLTLCKKHQKDMDGQPMVKAWRKVLDLDDNVEDIVVMSKVGLVYVLPSQISGEINRFDDLDKRLFLGWQNDLAKAFTHISFTTAFREFTGKLTDSLLINIEFCSHELSKRCPEKMIDLEELKKLKESTYRLYQEIQHGELPPDLTRFLLDHLYLIIDAIDNYTLTGSRGLRTSLDAVVGTVITDHAMAKRVKESVFGEPFWAVVGKTAIVLELAKTALELGEGVLKYLPGK